MKARHSLVLLLLGLAWIGSGCSSGPVEGSPEFAVNQFYEHLNAGELDRAKALYGESALAVIDDPNLSGEGAFQQWAELQTKNGTLDGVTIIGSETDGDDADVEFELRYADGSVKRTSVQLTREAGAWKLGLVG